MTRKILQRIFSQAENRNLWAAQKTSGRMIQRQNHSAGKLFCQKLSEFYSDFECLMAYPDLQSICKSKLL